MFVAPRPSLRPPCRESDSSRAGIIGSCAARRPKRLASKLLRVSTMSSAYGKVVSLSDAIELCDPVANRRGELRRRPSEVRWLRGARLKYGPEVVIVDISANGILIRNDREMSANAAIVFEFSGTTGTVLVLARVLRSRRVGSGGFVWYEIACRFKRPGSVGCRDLRLHRPPRRSEPCPDQERNRQRLVHAAELFIHEMSMQPGDLPSTASSARAAR